MFKSLLVLFVAVGLNAPAFADSSALVGETFELQTAVKVSSGDQDYAHQWFYDLQSDQLPRTAAIKCLFNLKLPAGRTAIFPAGTIFTVSESSASLREKIGNFFGAGDWDSMNPNVLNLTDITTGENIEGRFHCVYRLPMDHHEFPGDADGILTPGELVILMKDAKSNSPFHPAL